MNSDPSPPPNNPNPGGESPASHSVAATTALTHTGTIVGILTGIVAIVGFFGIRFGGGAPSTPPQPRPPSTSAPPLAKGTKPEPVHRRGIGTLHLEGGFAPGRPMLAQDALPAGSGLQAVRLLNPSNRRGETLPNSIVLTDVPAGELAGVWREGTRFVKGVKLSAPYLQLSGNGVNVQVPISTDGRLLANVVWPANRMFTDVAFPGPLDLNGWTLPNGLVFGDAGTQEGGMTLPERFSLDLPKPGEVLGAIEGEVRYVGGWAGDRGVEVEALSPTGDVAAAWTSPIDPAGHPAAERPNATLDQGLAGIRLLFEKR